MATNPNETPSLLLPITLQLLLALLGLYTLWIFPYHNGLLAHLAAQSHPGALLPDTTFPQLQHYTSIRPLDKQLTTLVSFFSTATSGLRADISLAFLSLGSHVIASWVLITLERLRPSNRSLFLITSTTILGLLVALIGFAVIAPLLFAYHLSASPTIHRPSPHQLLPPSSLAITLIPLTILLGFGLPSIIMSLPSPTLTSYTTKQLWTAIQQGWPLSIALSTVLLTIVASALDPSQHARTPTETRQSSLKALRRVYGFAFLTATSAHLLPLAVCALATLKPTLLPSTYAHQLQFGNVFGPPNPFDSSIKALTLADGALWFLQWDVVVGVLSVWLWGVTVGVCGRSEGGVGDVVKGVIGSLVVGPTAVAVWGVWARDEAVLGREEEAEQKKGR